MPLFHDFTGIGRRPAAAQASDRLSAMVSPHGPSAQRRLRRFLNKVKSMIFYEPLEWQPQRKASACIWIDCGEPPPV
jgi:hypothetical protein